jgi:hypothetical protein
MTTVAARGDLALLDNVFRDAVAKLPQVSRVVVVHTGRESSYVITISGDWIKGVPSIHHAVRPLRRSQDAAFRYRTIRESWREPDPTQAQVLYSRH